MSNRIVVCAALAILSFQTGVSAQTPNYQQNINLTSQWLVNNSTLPDGAILYTSSEIVPYYSNLAALGLVKDPTRYGHIKLWMDWYLNHLNWPDKWGLYGTVYDYNVSGSTETSTGNADSTDSYAGTFLSLAWAYYSTGDSAAQSYIGGLKYQLDVIGGVIVQTQQSDGLTWAKPDRTCTRRLTRCGPAGRPSPSIRRMLSRGFWWPTPGH
jgi:hypothetical protein